MATVRISCPYCTSEAVGMDLVYSCADYEAKNIWRCIVRCGICQGLVVLEVGIQKSNRTVMTPERANTDIRAAGFRIIESWPKKEKLTAPEHTPENIATFYIQAEDNRGRANWDSAGAMYRKAMDTSTKALGQTKGNLATRIDTLAAEDKLTEDLRKWAHVVRLGGNEAAHDEEPFSKEEVEDLQVFTELFLTYVFTLPKRLEIRTTPQGPAASAKIG